MKDLYSEECVCRLCGRKDQCENVKNIFENGSDLNLEIKISKLLHVVVLPWDPLPHDVCKTCVDKLNLFNEFYDDAIKTDQFLRTFFPSAPRNKMKKFNAIVSINDCIRSLKNYLKLPDYGYENTPESPMPAVEEDNVQMNGVNEGDDKPLSSVQSPKSLDGFIVSNITSSDSIFTCRECYRTFTKQNSALSHACMTIENCRDFELTEISEEESPREKALPPLKIRLFTNHSGKFICYLCQTSFDDRMEVVDHLKSHCLNGREKLGYKVRKRKKSGSRKNSLDLDVKKSCEIQTPTDLNELGPMEDLKQIKCSFSPDMTHMNSTENLDAYTPDTNIFLENWKTDKSMNEKTSNTISEYIVKMNEFEDSKVKEASRRKSREKKDHLFSCVFCDKIYTRKDFLRQHQKKHLGSAKDTIRFLYSEESDVEENESDRHVGKGISRDGVYVCDICSMVFTKKKTLMVHESYHYVNLKQELN